MRDPVRRLSFGDAHIGHLDPALEWLITNGLGGYASGPVFGGLTRRLHGVLVAALPAPIGRMVIVNHVRTTLMLGQREALIDHERIDALDSEEAAILTEFRLEAGLPIWTYNAGGAVLEKRLFMPYLENTTYAAFTLRDASGPARLRFEPMMHVRALGDSVSGVPFRPTAVTTERRALEIDLGPVLPPLRLAISADAEFHLDRQQCWPVEYGEELARGYEHEETLWSPGSVIVDLDVARPVALRLSVDAIDPPHGLALESALQSEIDRRATLLNRTHPLARAGIAAELTLAADQFVITPATRVRETLSAEAAGDQACTVIAGYHWFTDWGRDTMISLEGLTLMTGRIAEAGQILRTFGHHVRDGLIPNMFPEGKNVGLYHTADATLWFFHALDRYVQVSGDLETLQQLLPTMVDIADHHLRGTRFGIGVDAGDGLLRQGADGYQLTWMDAKVDGWVVTPRRGKAVEINALWYAALRTLVGWLKEAGRDADAQRYDAHADRAYLAFNERFWNEETGFLYDVVDGEHGDDPACRPNQLFAMSLPHAVLDPARWAPVLASVSERLLTPVGLRSLSPDHPDYRTQYHGDLQTRDAAYHQGTVWAWLIGAYVDAWLKVHPGDHAGARRCLEGFPPHLSRACVGSISEIFDAESPFTARGCIAQAWSVAELLRCWIRTDAAMIATPAGSR